MNPDNGARLARSFRQYQPLSGCRQSKLPRRPTGCGERLNARSRPIFGPWHLGIRRDARRRAVIATGSGHILDCRMRSLHHYSESTDVPVGNFDNDGQGPDAENLYADQPDPNAVTDRSRLGCGNAYPAPFEGRRRSFAAARPIFLRTSMLAGLIQSKTCQLIRRWQNHRLDFKAMPTRELTTTPGARSKEAPLVGVSAAWVVARGADAPAAPTPTPPYSPTRAKSFQLRRMHIPTGCSRRPTAATHLEASSTARHTAAMIMAARIEVFQQQLSRCCRHCHRRITAPWSVTNVIQSAKTAAFSTEGTGTMDRGQNVDALELRRPGSVAAILFGALHSHAAAGFTVTARVSVQQCAVGAAACGDVRHHKPLSTNDGPRETVPIRLRAESSF